MDASRGSRRRGVGWFAAGLVQTAVLLGLSVWLARPPLPAPVDAPEEEFSARRALALLERLMGPDEAPRPMGSAANRAARARLVTELESLGLEAELHGRVICNPGGVCGEVVNVLARLPGRSLATSAEGETAPGEAILLVAHYDSVVAGPGAGDDLSGIACLLEIARALSASDEPRSAPVFLLFTDGEEMGLLGAWAFAQHHPWMQEVGVVVNLEARGTSGGSILFETGADNAWLVERYGRLAARPNAASYSVEIYRRMPNDTDFTPFRFFNKPGLNFAFIEDVCDYHTPNDSLARLDLRSVQHHGDNVLPLVHDLARTGLGDRRAGDLVYSDLGQRAFLAYPVGWCVPLWIAELALFVLAAWRASRAGGPGRAGSSVVREGFAELLRLAGTAALCVAAGYVLARLFAFQPGAVGALYPAPVWTAYVAVAVAVIAFRGGPRRAATGPGLALALAWLVLAGVTTFAAPGASHLFSLPLGFLLLGLALLPGSFAGDRPLARCVFLVAGAVTTCLWTPLVLGLGNAFGLGPGSALVGVLLAPLGWLVPLAADARRDRLRTGFLALVVLIPASVAAVTLERLDPSVPARLTFHHLVLPGEGEARVLADISRGVLPATLEGVFEEPLPDDLAPFFEGPAGSAEAFPNAPSPPRLDVLGRSVQARRGQRLLVRLSSPGRAGLTWLRFQRLVGVRVLSGAGLPDFDATDWPDPEELTLPSTAGSAFVFVGVPEDGVLLELSYGSEDPLDVIAVDEHWRSSPRLSELRALAGPDYVPSHRGDSLLVGARREL